MTLYEFFLENNWCRGADARKVTGEPITAGTANAASHSLQGVIKILLRTNFTAYAVATARIRRVLKDMGHPSAGGSITYYNNAIAESKNDILRLLARAGV